MNRVNIEEGGISWAAGAESSFSRSAKARLNGLDEDDRKLLAVTAMIRPGASGGPLILTSGLVAGLNVGYRPNFKPIEIGGALGEALRGSAPMISRPPKQDYLDIGVPLTSVWKLLNENNITLDQGPTTALWHEGLALYEAGDWETALAKFREVASRQLARPPGWKPYGAPKGQPVRIVSQYVQEMIDRCVEDEK
jgi:hypothetical protein